MTFQNEIVAGTVLVREAIESENFAPGVAGWKIWANGDAEFNDVTVRGDLIAGTATDYVKVSSTPSPHIEFASSAAAVDTTGRLGFDAAGGDVFALEAPEFSGTGAASKLEFTPAGTELQAVNGNLRLEAVVGDVEVIGSTVELGGAAPTNRVTIDPAGKTFATYGTDRGKGVLDFTPVILSTALGAAETVGVTSGSVDFEVGRAYRITLHYQGSGNTLGDEVGFRMRRTSVLGNSLFDSLRTHRLNAASAIVNGETSQIVTNQTGANLSTVIVGTVYRPAGAGNVQMFANATNPVWLLIEDIGASSDYPGARAL